MKSCGGPGTPPPLGLHQILFSSFVKLLGTCTFLLYKVLRSRFESENSHLRVAAGFLKTNFHSNPVVHEHVRVRNL